MKTQFTVTNEIDDRGVAIIRLAQYGAYKVVNDTLALADLDAVSSVSTARADGFSAMFSFTRVEDLEKLTGACNNALQEMREHIERKSVDLGVASNGHSAADEGGASSDS